MITIPMKEYKELLQIKGSYLETLRKSGKEIESNVKIDQEKKEKFKEEASCSPLSNKLVL